MLSNKQFLLISFVAAMLVAIAPFAIGQAMTPPGSQFYGNKLIAPADYSIYYSYINQGAQGHVFMYDAFTSEAHTATLFQPVWLIVGLAARLLTLNTPVAFALARYATIPIFLFVLWWVAGWIWAGNERRRRVGFVLSIVASGLGGILTIVGPQLASFPWTYPDLWVSEAYSVLTLWSSAHFLLVTSGIIFTLVAVERSWLERRWSWTLWAGLVAAATLSIHPFHIITWLMLWVGLTVWRWITTKKIPWAYIGRWFTVVLISGPVLLLYGFQYVFDPLTVYRSIQNVNFSSAPWAMIIGLGLPFILSFIGAWQWRHKDERWRWMIVLGCAYIAAAYAPVLFQRRLTQGMLLPFIWLSVPVFETLILSHRQRTTGYLVATAIGLVLSTSWLLVGLILVKDYAHDLRDPIRMYYIDREHQDLATYLRTLDPHQPLLGSLIESNVIAGLTAHQVYVGYGVETWNFSDKLKTMDGFFADMSASEERQLLQRSQLCYVLTSPRTRAKGAAFQPETWPDLKRVWSDTNLALYQTPYCR